MNSCKDCKLNSDECICEDVTQFFNETGHLMRKDETVKPKATRLPAVFALMAIVGTACSTAQLPPSNMSQCSYMCKQHAVDSYKDDEVSCNCKANQSK